MIPGENWKADGHIPTHEDLRKYITLRTNLLVAAECYQTPFTCRIAQLSPNEQFIEINTSGNFFNNAIWLPVNGIEILDIVEYPQPVERKLAAEIAEETQASPSKQRAAISAECGPRGWATRAITGT